MCQIVSSGRGASNSLMCSGIGKNFRLGVDCGCGVVLGSKAKGSEIISSKKEFDLRNLFLKCHCGKRFSKNVGRYSWKMYKKKIHLPLDHGQQFLLKLQMAI
jgi:hypothetical protein